MLPPFAFLVSDGYYLVIMKKIGLFTILTMFGMRAFAALVFTSPANQSHADLSGFTLDIGWSSSVSLISLTPYVNGVAQTCFTGICSGTGGTLGLDTSSPPLVNGYCVYVIHLRGTDGSFNYDSGDLVIYDLAKPYSGCQGAPTRCAGGSSATAPQMGRPVDLATGKMWAETEDLRIDSPLPLVFSRRYNHKRASVNGPLGYGWTHNFNVSVSSLNGSYVFRNEEGRDIYFTPTLGGIFGASRDHLNFAVIAGGYTITDKSKNKWTFTNTTGKLTEIRDRNNNTLTLVYVGGNLSTITDIFGRAFTFAYDASNRITSVTDGTRTVGYTLYDASGNLKTVNDAAGKVWTYGYSNASFIHNLTSITDPLGQIAEAFTYTAGDLVQTFQKDSGNELLTFTYTSATQTSVTNAIGAGTAATLDPLNGVATAVTGPGCTECTGGNNVSYILDPDFNKTQTTDGNGNITKRTFDAAGNVLTRTDAFGTPQQRTITFTYQPTFNFIATRSEPSVDTVAQNRVETNSYNATGDLLNHSVAGYSNGAVFTHATAYTYDVHGQVLTIDGPRTDLADITTNTYYADNDPTLAKRGRLNTNTNPLGQVTTTSAYTISGKPTIMLDPNGVETDMTYDGLDRLTASTIKGAIPAADLTTSYTLNNIGLPTTTTLPLLNTIVTGYDPVNRPTTTTDQPGNKAISVYDAQGRKTREELQDPAAVVKKVTNFRYDNLNRLDRVCFDGAAGCAGSAIFTQYSYDNNSNLTSMVDPLGHLTCHDYDPLNRKKATRQFISTPQPASCAAPCTGPSCTLIQSQFGYDSQDHQISVTDPNNLATAYKVDDEGWTLRQTSPDSGITNYTYDGAGNLKTKTNANSIVESRTYDALNRLLTITYPDTTQNIAYSYDLGVFGISHRTGMTDPAGNTIYGYDRFGRLIQENRTPAGQTNYFTAYNYDKNGNLTGLTYPSGRQITYAYDTADRVSSVSGQVNGANATVANAFSYAPFGPRTGETFGNALADARSFDSRYRIQSWTLGTLISKTHIWNNDDNLTNITDNLNAANNRTFGYDEIHRLNLANTGTALWQTGSYTYDPNGNRLTNAEGALSVNYSVTASTNRLASATGSEPATFGYDANGNTTGDTTHTYQYSQRDRLTTVDTGTTGVYAYDGDGRRVKKTAGATTTLYFYDPTGKLLEEYQPGTSTGSDTLWYIGSYDPLSRIDFTLADTDNGNVLRCSKASPNEHLDWSLDGTVGPFTVRRSNTFNFANPFYLGSAQSAKAFDDPVLLSPANFAYSISRRTLNDTPYYFHADHLGTPIAVTNNAGTLVWRVEHRPFGGIFSQTASIANNLRFPGQYFDSETGFAQNYFRDYDAKIGRYTEPDPLSSSIVNINIFATNHLSNGIFSAFLSDHKLPGLSYSYLDNNPLVNVDPAGLLPWPFGNWPRPWSIPRKREDAYRPSCEPSMANCSLYPEGSAPWRVCRTTPKSPWANCVRSCLLARYPNSTTLEYYISDHTYCFISCKLGHYDPPPGYPNPLDIRRQP